MFNQSKNRKLSLFLLVFVLACATGVGAATPPPPPPPPTVTITDNFGSSHGNFIRWDRFSTDLSAAIQNPPQTTQETTITGPTYSWAVVSQNPSSPTISIVDSGNGNATLQSPIPSKSICFVAGGGTYDVKVNCTITYTSTDNKTGVATPLGYSADPPLDVTFFVRVPVQVMETAARSIDDLNGDTITTSTYSGPAWGFISVYPFEVLDNQSPRQSYGNGLVQESFSSVSPAGTHPNGPNGGDAWTLHSDGTGSPTDTWTDANFIYFKKDPGTIDQNAFEDSFNQNWDCIEATPPYASPQLYATFDNMGGHQFLPSTNDTSLTPQMSVKVYDGYAIRSFPGDPYPD